MSYLPTRQQQSYLPTANPLDALVLPRTERGLLGGATGSGKSTLAQYLIQDKWESLVIIDPKHDFEIPFDRKQYSIVSRPDELTKTNRTIQVCRLDPESSSLADYDRIFKWIYLRRNTFVYIDEGIFVTQGPNKFPFFLQAIYQLGRSRGIGALCVTQRPVQMPGFIFSECSAFWMFRLVLGQDIEKLEEWLAPFRNKQGIISNDFPGWDSRHSFWFRNIYNEAPATEFILDIKGG
jgi:hypothetical protein